MNRLKTVHGGSVLSSEACLISNRKLLAEDKIKLQRARSLVEMIEGYQASREYYSVTANMKGETPEDVASYILNHTEISGLRGPTISKVYSSDGEGWYAVTVIVEKDRLLDAVEHLRQIGGSSVTVSHPNYVFHSETKAHARLI